MTLFPLGMQGGARNRSLNWSWQSGWSCSLGARSGGEGGWLHIVQRRRQGTVLIPTESWTPSSGQERDSRSTPPDRQVFCHKEAASCHKELSQRGFQLSQGGCQLSLMEAMESGPSAPLHTAYESHAKLRPAAARVRVRPQGQATPKGTQARAASTTPRSSPLRM